MKTLVLLALLACTTINAQRLPTTPPHRWADSFEAYKAGIRRLDSAETRECENLLRAILEGIDRNATCTTWADCTLLNQQPFGRTVPVRVDYSRTLLRDMKHFFNACDDGSFHSVNDTTTTDVAVCWAGKCMVNTSFAK